MSHLIAVKTAVRLHVCCSGWLCIFSILFDFCTIYPLLPCSTVQLNVSKYWHSAVDATCSASWGTIYQQRNRSLIHRCHMTQMGHSIQEDEDFSTRGWQRNVDWFFWKQKRKMQGINLKHFTWVNVQVVSCSNSSESIYLRHKKQLKLGS